MPRTPRPCLTCVLKLCAPSWREHGLLLRHLCRVISMGDAVLCSVPSGCGVGCGARRLPCTRARRGHAHHRTQLPPATSYLSKNLASPRISETLAGSLAERATAQCVHGCVRLGGWSALVRRREIMTDGSRRLVVKTGHQERARLSFAQILPKTLVFKSTTPLIGRIWANIDQGCTS